MPPITAVRLAAAGLLCLTSACKEERDQAPRVPTSGGMSVSVKKPDASTLDAAGPVRDAGLDEDAGPLPLEVECDDVPVADFAGESPATGRYLNAVDDPEDFRVTRTLATWGPTCSPPTIVLVMSDGACPDGRGHELEFSFDATAIQSGLISTGQNNLESDSISKILRVRYQRPRGLTPDGVWGTCSDVPPSMGLTIRDTRLGVGYGARFEATFEMTLGSCDDSENAPLLIQGSFDMRLRRSIDEVCPSP